MSKKQTPLMVQYHAIKEEYPGIIIFFQVGDFYELFFEDAIKAAEVLAIALTKRGTDTEGNPIPLCGVPVHALQHYLAKLVRAGFHVAICDQLEPPKPGSVVKRGVTQVLTPGTLTDSTLLDDKHASFLCSFFPMQEGMGIFFAELLTAQLHATILTPEAVKSLEAELTRFLPDEILVPSSKEGGQFARWFAKQGYQATGANFFDDDPELFQQWVVSQFNKEVHQRVDQELPIKNALHNLHGYLNKNQSSSLTQFNAINFYEPDDFLMLDASTQKNLELLRNLNDGSRNHTLYALLDKATTPMGSRTLAKWIMRPLVDQAAINQRLDAVETLVGQPGLLHGLKKLLQQIGDSERVIGRIALARGAQNDYQALQRMLKTLPEIKEQILRYASSELLIRIALQFIDFSSLVALLDAALNDDQSTDWLIKKGFNQKLDMLRAMVHDSRSLILAMEKEEQEKTGISSLKIRYTNAHGYFIEITKANMHLVPDRFIRTQTLVGKERYTTDALKKLQAEIMTASQQIEAVERELFDGVKREVSLYSSSLRKASYAVAHCDALCGVATVSYDHDYKRPFFNNGNSLSIIKGRHPVIEHALGAGFIPNDTELHDEQSLLLITGPNMGGKSTYLRQTALLAIMAQMGSFVPAEKFDCAIRDRIFTRIGASDNVAAGKSTFLVEMEETAAICRYATENSLIILDEVGRGTSTYDGLALAQAIVEYIATTIKARCLFATHYHELTELGNQLSTIVPFYAASKRTNNGIIFLHTIIKGVSDGSFGIEVAKLADLPLPIITRASNLLDQLQDSAGYSTFLPATKAESSTHSDNRSNMLKEQRLQQEIDKLKTALSRKKSALSALAAVDPNDLSPRQAFDLIWKIKEGM